MIQVGTSLTVVDNSGARRVKCIHVHGGYRRRYAKIGDTVLVSIKELRLKRKDSVKVKKGEVHLALIVQTKSHLRHASGGTLSSLSNSVVLLTKQKKTRGYTYFLFPTTIFS